MGLSVKWATFNVGASKPEECGNHYAWGETFTKSNFDWVNYRLGAGVGQMFKYCTSNAHGDVDNKTILEPEDDVAHVRLGDSWRMPEAKEFEELINLDNCRRIRVENYNGTGVNGYIVRGKKEGFTNNSIFIPEGCYWSSSVNEDWSSAAWYLYVHKKDMEILSGGLVTTARNSGSMVRPVSAE